jgi:hypothetical protein
MIACPDTLASRPVFLGDQESEQGIVAEAVVVVDAVSSTSSTCRSRAFSDVPQINQRGPITCLAGHGTDRG